MHDESMLPTLRPGDRLLVDRRAYRNRPPRAGEIVVLVDPEAPDRWLVKRVADVDATDGSLEVRGDAIENARDSRRFGRVAPDAIVGRVYRRYFPPDRRREL
ncbi:MAG: nickel-type superoxide dismutase maturation protease [Thermoplasmata archaeon]